MKNCYPTTINKKIIAEILKAKTEDFVIYSDYRYKAELYYYIHLRNAKTNFEINIYKGGYPVVVNRSNDRWDCLYHYLPDEWVERFESLRKNLPWKDSDYTPVISTAWREALEYVEHLPWKKDAQDSKAAMIRALELAFGNLDIITDGDGKLQVKGYRRYPLPRPCFTWEEVENGKAKEILEALS